VRCKIDSSRSILDQHIMTLGVTIFSIHGTLVSTEQPTIADVDHRFI